MKYFRYETPERQVNLYPLVCWHIGAPQSDSGFIAGMIERVHEDPLARWFYLGDGGECVTKQSKGDVYTQTMSPMAQQNRLVELMKPIAAKGLFGIKGNHGSRIYKETGLDFDETLMARVGLPYLGTAAFWQMKLRAGFEHPAIFSIFTHHGTDSGVGMASKVNKATGFDRTYITDAIITAHSHIALDLPPRYYVQHADPRTVVGDPIRWSATHEYIAGCAYDSRTGYAEDKGYPPLLPAHIVVEFSTNASGIKRQTSQIIRKEDL